MQPVVFHVRPLRKCSLKLSIDKQAKRRPDRRRVDDGARRQGAPDAEEIEGHGAQDKKQRLENPKDEIIKQLAIKAQGASSALNEIVTLVDDTSDQVRAIATASEQQSATSEEINRSITEINTISRETSQTMQEASKAIMELSRQAQELSALIQNMKNS